MISAQPWASRPLVFLLLALGLLLQLVSDSAGDDPGQVFILDLEGAISPASAMYVKRGIETASEKGAALVVIRLDTPGGLASSMRTIVKAILNSTVPVAVYVAPSGASAASAGVMVTVAAHVAAMAPGTNIGAAHPVGAGGKDIDKTMSEKVVNDMAAYARSIAEERGRSGEWVEKAIRESVSITADEAVEKHVVDMIAVDLDDLLRKMDGREVMVAGKKVTLRTLGLKRVYYKPGLRDRVLGTISDPNISYILMMIGLAGLYFELAHPGAIFPGVIGGISLILAFYSFQALPVNYAGLLLILLGVIFFILETQVPSFGMLSVGGLVSFVLGSMMLFEDIGISLSLMMPTILLVGAFFVVVAGLAFRAQRARPSSGKEGLLGEKGFARDTIDPEGLVFVHGEHWKALSEERIEPGERVEVVAMEGLILKVRKIPNRSIE
jgi:membrane-bound serine protease (ClpP class)